MRWRLKLLNRRGATLAVVAVSLVALLAIMSLAIDMGMMYSARNEAQRVADAAALAGASAFCDRLPAEAEARALEYATANNVLSRMVEAGEADIAVDFFERQVRVIIHRQQIPTWFARILGIDEVAVNAVATAECAPAGAAECVRPWAIQDMWHEEGATLPVEEDTYDPVGDNDNYVPVNPFNHEEFATGYGAFSRGGDFGTEMALKTPSPAPQSGDLEQPGPGEFLIWEMPPDPGMEQCGMNGTDNNAGYANAICGCNRNLIELGVDYPVYYGNRPGPTNHGFNALLDKDPDAEWTGDPTNPVSSPLYTGWDSPRIVPIALMEPLPPPPDGDNHYNASNLTTVRFTNIALMFVESATTNGQQQLISGRFLRYASGQPGSTGMVGSGMNYLRLVE